MVSGHPSRDDRAAAGLLDALVDGGVDYVFATLGTDHAPLIDAMARRHQAGISGPRLILCPHENVAVHMAAGVAAACGRAQVVLLHVDVGTAMAGVGTHNLCRARLPALLMAGRAPQSDDQAVAGARDTYVHYIQDCADQGGLLRPFVKWEYTLGSADLAEAAVERALTVANSDPPGPVYLMLPREVLEARPSIAADRTPGNAARRPPPTRTGAAPAARLQEVARLLATASEPMIVTSYLGRRAEAVPALETLADLVGASVFEFAPCWMNFPRSSPCHAGENPSGMVGRADVGLLVDVDVPWIASEALPAAGSRWFQFDLDTVKRGIPMWRFPVDGRFEGDSATMLGQLVEMTRTFMSSEQLDRARERRDRLRALQAPVPGRADHDRTRFADDAPLTVRTVCEQLHARLEADDVIVNEAVSHAAAVRRHVARNVPGTLFGLAGGGLGFSAGMALGIKLVRPGVRVVRIVGDGAYQIGDPVAALNVSRACELAVLTVVLDNGGWRAVALAVDRMYPGRLDAQALSFATEVPAILDHVLLARACGAHGESVTDLKSLQTALTRCIAMVDAGRSAVLHVRIEGAP